MQRSGTGRRWDSVDTEMLRKHSPTRDGTPDAPLVQEFEPPGGRPVLVNLTFLGSRPKLGRILANTFWMTYQSGPRPEDGFGHSVGTENILLVSRPSGQKHARCA